MLAFMCFCASVRFEVKVAGSVGRLRKGSWIVFSHSEQSVCNYIHVDCVLRKCIT